MSNIREQLDWLYGLGRFGMKPGLDTIAAMMAALGHPERQFSHIHIAGTNGKGSTAAMTESIMRHAGYTTGLYTSPHMFTFSERIQINGQPITDQYLSQLIDQVQQVSKNIEGKDNDGPPLQPTFFECATAMAFIAFAQQEVDIAVVEVGVGGLLDATNILPGDIGLITNIGLDHTHILGHTKADIARKKAGIIKPGMLVGTAEADPDIKQLLTIISQSQSAALHHIDQPASLSDDQQKQDILTTIKLPLLGAHQQINARLAILGLQLAQQKHHLTITQQHIRDGLTHTKWPGRIQILSTNPCIVVDGAHNEDSVQALVAALPEVIPSPPPTVVKKVGERDVKKTGKEKGAKAKPQRVLIIGAKDSPHKQPADIFAPLLPFFDIIITTEGQHQAMPAHQLATHLQPVTPPGTTILTRPVPEQAVNHAQRLIHANKNSYLVITGSLYMIPAAIAAIEEHKLTEPLIP